MTATIRPRTDEWYAARRELITSTDIPILLGLSPYKSEADLAREKLGETVSEDPRNERERRLGRALEAVIREEDELEHGIRLRRVNRILVHPFIRWAGTSLDFERVGDRCIVEAKSSRSARWDEKDAEGQWVLPQDVEAQVRWQMAVGGYPRAHVAALRHGSELACYDLEHDEETFQGLVVIAEDFRRRLAEGGPFAESLSSIRRRFPADDGSEMTADAETAEAARELLSVRAQRKGLEATEEALETAIKTRMGEAAVLVGPGFRATWKRTKDREETDWRTLADGLLRQIPETDRAAVVGIHTSVRPGFRPFRLVSSEEKA